MRKFIAVIIMSFFMFGLIACGKKEPDAVIGRWECIEADVFGSGTPLSEYRYYDLTHQSLRETTNMTFYEDGSINILVYGSAVEGTHEYPYTWKNENGTYVVSIDYPEGYNGEKQLVTFNCTINKEDGKMDVAAVREATDSVPSQTITFKLEQIVKEEK